MKKKNQVFLNLYKILLSLYLITYVVPRKPIFFNVVFSTVGYKKVSRNFNCNVNFF